MTNRSEWIELYLSGLSLRDISTYVGVSSGTIARELKKQKVTLRPSGGKVTFDPQIAIDLWKQEYTLEQIGEKLGVNRTAIYEQLKKYNIDTTRSNLQVIKDLIQTGLSVSQITEKTGNSHTYVCRVARDIGLSVKQVRLRHIANVINKYTHLQVQEAVEEIVKETGSSKREIARRYFDATGDLLPTRSSRCMQLLIEQHRQYLLDSISSGKSIYRISSHTRIDARNIKLFIQQNNLTYKPISYHISKAAYKRLTNQNWCRAALNRIGRQGAIKIVELLNYECGPDTVRTYFAKFGLDIHPSVYEYYPQLLDKQWLEEQYKTKPYAEIASDLGVSHPIIRDALMAQGIEISKEYHVSKVELQLRDFISSIYDGPTIYNDRSTISPHEIDILLPDLKIGIEFCGIYWHSERYKPNDYHLTKLNNCNNQQIRLIQIFENEWMFSRSIVENKLKSILCIFQPTCFARNTSIINQIDYGECAVFLNRNHIQGQDASSIRIGLNHNNTLVAVMTFKCYQDGGVELNRFATNGNVPGAFTKLLKHFQKTHQYTYITTFADLRWSSLQSNVYQKHGFEFVHTTKPSYYYYCYKSKQLLHRMKFQRKKLPKFLGDKFNPELTERENANNAGYVAIYDCGHAKYILRP
jgi:transposase-like protein